MSFSVDEHIFDASFLDSVTKRWGEKTLERVLAWESVLIANSGQTIPVKLEQVNGFFNRMRSLSDETNWGERDYWASPVEMLAAGGGDCEDFAIAKYFSLKLLGIAEDRLRLAYVRSYGGRSSLRIVPHLVLLFYADADAEPLVLDNLIPEIKPASQRKDLAPTYSFNASGLWQVQQRNRSERIGDTTHLYKWQDLLRRMAP